MGVVIKRNKSVIKTTKNINGTYTVNYSDSYGGNAKFTVTEDKLSVILDDK